MLEQIITKMFEWLSKLI